MQPDGTYHLRLNHSTPINQVVMEAVMEEPLVVPVVAEELTVEKRRVARGIVRVRTRIETRQEVVDEPLLREEVVIEPDARRLWEEKNPDSWEQVKDAIRFSWEQVRGTH